jgi:hypothetical protein
MLAEIDAELFERLGADGTLLDQATFCARSSLSPKELADAVAAGKVLRIDDSDGAPAYPAFHVDPSINQVELAAVLKRISDFPPTAQWLFLTTAKGSLATAAGIRRTPLAALRDGDFSAVERTATGFVGH